MKKITFMKDFMESGWQRPAVSLRSNLAKASAPVVLSFVNAEGAICAANAVPTNQEEYARNLIAINQFMVGILSSELPSIYPSPAHLSEYAVEMAKAKASALQWNSVINAHLLSLPKITAENLNDLHDLFAGTQEIVRQLIDDPSSVYLRKQLSSRIEQSKTGVCNIIKDVEGLIDKLEVFHDDMPNQAAALKKISDLMLQDKAADDKKVLELTNSIKSMNAEISSLTAAIVALGIADAAALVISGLALLAGPAGFLVWIFTGAAIAAATTFIVLYAKKISSLKDQIKEKQKEVGDYNTAIAALITNAENYKIMAETSTALQTNLKYMVGEWKKIESGLEEIEVEIDKASADYDKSDWQSVDSDFEDAKQKCTILVAEVKKLDISNMQGTDASIEIGMTEAQIKAALSKANTMSIVDYIKKVG